MAGRKHKEEYNKNWKAEITAYDKECQCLEKEFYKTHIIITESSNDGLTVEENEVLNLYLNGFSFEEIAKQYKVEVEVVTGLMEVIRAKLSLTD